MRKIRKVPPKDAFRDAVLMNSQTYNDYLDRMIASLRCVFTTKDKRLSFMIMTTDISTLWLAMVGI